MRKTKGRKGHTISGEWMSLGISSGSAEEQNRSREVNWMPLLIVIGAAYLISMSLYTVTLGLYGNDYKLESQLSLILSFIGSTALIATIASVIYSREDMAKKLLLLGMLLLIIQIALRTSVYLRAL